MIPSFESSGNLPSGEHEARWDEFVDRFGTTPYREELIDYLRQAIHDLRAYGCKTVYVDGSFVTRKQTPRDYDCCWDLDGVRMGELKRNLSPFANFRSGRIAQKVKYKGEFFPSDSPADAKATPYLRYFQKDKRTGKPKGIIVLRTEEVP